MSLLLKTGETDRLSHALALASRDALVAGPWFRELTAAVAELLHAGAVLIQATPNGVRVVADAAGPGRADWDADFGRLAAAAAASPAGVWHRLTRGPSALGRRRDLVGMTARAPGGDASLTLVCLTPPPPDAEAAEHRAAVLRLLFPAFEAAVRRRGDHAALPAAAAAAAPDTGAYVDDAAAALRRRYRLTPREMQVTRLLLHGKSNGEIAGALGISGHTARHHTERVFSKLAVRSRATLWSVAYEKPRAARSGTGD